MRVPLWWAIGVAWPNTLAIAFEQRFARDRFSQKFPLQRPFFIAIVGTGRNMRKIASAAFFIAPLLAVAPALALDDLIPAGWQGKIAADSVCSDEKSLPQIAKFEADSGDAGSVLNCDYSLSAATGDVVTVVDSRKLLTTTGDDSTTYWEIHVRDRGKDFWFLEHTKPLKADDPLGDADDFAYGLAPAAANTVQPYVVHGGRLLAGWRGIFAFAEICDSAETARKFFNLERKGGDALLDAKLNCTSSVSAGLLGKPAYADPDAVYTVVGVTNLGSATDETGVPSKHWLVDARDPSGRENWIDYAEFNTFSQPIPPPAN